ncbi:hypothetical protein ACNKHK_22830 [Shigella flexneri]
MAPKTHRARRMNHIDDAENNLREALIYVENDLAFSQLPRRCSAKPNITAKSKTWQDVTAGERANHATLDNIHQEAYDPLLFACSA